MHVQAQLPCRRAASKKPAAAAIMKKPAGADIMKSIKKKFGAAKATPTKHVSIYPKKIY